MPEWRVLLTPALSYHDARLANYHWLHSELRRGEIVGAIAEQIQFAKKLLKQRVSAKPDDRGGCRILFDAPDRDEMVALGVDEEVADRIAGASWWNEMQEAVVETPEFCEPDADADEVLNMARDTIDEYISKRY